MYCLFNHHAGLRGDPAMGSLQFQVRAWLGRLDHISIYREFLMHDTRLHHVNLTFLSTGFCDYCHGIHARLLCLRLWPTHQKSRKIKSANDLEGT
jgi:hypothetical protein